MFSLSSIRLASSSLIIKANRVHSSLSSFANYPAFKSNQSLDKLYSSQSTTAGQEKDDSLEQVGKGLSEFDLRNISYWPTVIHQQ